MKQQKKIGIITFMIIYLVAMGLIVCNIADDTMGAVNECMSVRAELVAGCRNGDIQDWERRFVERDSFSVELFPTGELDTGAGFMIDSDTRLMKVVWYDDDGSVEDSEYYSVFN